MKRETTLVWPSACMELMWEKSQSFLQVTENDLLAVNMHTGRVYELKYKISVLIQKLYLPARGGGGGWREKFRGLFLFKTL